MAIDYVAGSSNGGLTLKLYRGEDMALLAFDVDETLRKPEFMGFGIEYKIGDKEQWYPVYNFLTFNKLRLQAEAFRKAHPKEKPDFSYLVSMRSPIQRFRWLHVPSHPINDTVTYRVSAMFWLADNQPPVAHATTSATIDLGSETRGKFLNVGFTRGYATSQAYLRNFPDGKSILPARGKSELAFNVKPYETDGKEYPWLGFETRRILLDFLDECLADASVSIDVFAYDFAEPEVVIERLQKFKKRLRILIDDSAKHGKAASDESKAAKLLAASAGAANVKRHHFASLQHNKVVVAKRNDAAFAVFTGSTNFSLRGLYIQANNGLLFRDADIAGWYAKAFAAAFPSGQTKFKTADFTKAEIASKWFEKNQPDAGTYRFCFSPHKDPKLSMQPIADAVGQAKSSVFYAIAFRGAETGPADVALNKIDIDKLLVMGVADKPGKKKGAANATVVQLAGRGAQALPPGTLAGNLPEPFKSEWSGGSGVRLHHKFVICDFNRPNAVVFTGSSNLASGGEQKNGDNLIEIRDPKVVIAYAVESVRIFDHYDFRNRMVRAKKQPKAYDLAEPPVGNAKAWWGPCFEKGNYKMRDRELFAG
jgi:phosphatidylserine/phosphatidylglycerophosphate/cardiolipin synthase-like enzyme